MPLAAASSPAPATQAAFGLDSRPIIELSHVYKSFGSQQVLKDISFSILPNEFVTMLGPSGCGKSTTLRILAGFEQPDRGEVLFEGKDLLRLPPYQRPLNTVFQRFALFPHLNVYDNVAFGLKVKKRPAEEIHSRVQDALRMVDLSGYERRWVDQLSGGQMQRVAIARAIVNQPKVLLLDEPLGSLDLKLRKDMQRELKAMQHQLGITFIFVTHDQEEALTMSDKIIVMDHGVIHQVGQPTDIYNEPKNAFVADFIGESNILSGTMANDYAVRFFNRDFPCLDPRPGAADVDVVIRPEDIDLIAPGSDHLQGSVRSVLFKGVHYEMMVEVECPFAASPDECTLLVHSTDRVDEGSAVGLDIVPDAIHIMAKSPRRNAAAGTGEDLTEPAAR